MMKARTIKRYYRERTSVSATKRVYAHTYTTCGMATNTANSATTAHQIAKNVRHDRRWLEQVTGREINTVLITRKQFRVFKIDSLLKGKPSLLSLRGTPE